MTTKDRELADIGKSAYASIAEMVAALNCDYDRLEELRDERADLEAEAIDDTNAEQAEARRLLAAWDEENGEEFKELQDAAGECADQDDARQRIEEDALSVQVRGAWRNVGTKDDDEADEFEILLTTGGPAVRIRGELDRGVPCRAWLEVQDWGTPWTQYFDADEDVLLAYSTVFYFDE